MPKSPFYWIGLILIVVGASLIDDTKLYFGILSLIIGFGLTFDPPKE